MKKTTKKTKKIKLNENDLIFVAKELYHDAFAIVVFDIIAETKEIQEMISNQLAGKVIKEKEESFIGYQ